MTETLAKRDVLMTMRILRRTGPSALGLWFVAMLVVGASLLARHAIALPMAPAAELDTAVATLRSEGDAGRWLAVHVLYAECRCSQRIAERLLSSIRPSDVVEQVLLVGRDEDLERRLASRGFRVFTIDEDELARRFHIQAAPLFLVAAPNGSVRYAGGYTKTKQGLDLLDRDILAVVRAGRAVEPLPVLGCAVSRALKQDMNPLGLP